MNPDEDALQSAFRKRKLRGTLTPEEQLAERDYDRARRQRRVQIFLSSREEVIAWRRSARHAGYQAVGEWAAQQVRENATMREALARDVEDWRQRALRAEARESVLRARLEALTRAGAEQLGRGG